MKKMSAEKKALMLRLHVHQTLQQKFLDEKNTLFGLRRPFNIPSLTFCISMLSGAKSGNLGSCQTGSVASDPLFSIQEQSPAALLPPTTLPCLFTHQPPGVSVRVYVYHNYRALQPPLVRVPLLATNITAQHVPNPDMARFLISPFLPPVPERDTITASAPPSFLSSTIAPLIQSGVKFTVSHCVYHPADLPAADPIMEEVFHSFLFVFDYTQKYFTSPFC